MEVAGDGAGGVGHERASAPSPTCGSKGLETARARYWGFTTRPPSGSELAEHRAQVVDGELAVPEECVVPFLEVGQSTFQSLSLTKHGRMGCLEPRERLSLGLELLSGSRKGSPAVTKLAGQTLDLGPLAARERAPPPRRSRAPSLERAAGSARRPGRTICLPLSGQGGVELNGRDGFRLDEHVPEQVLPLILCRGRRSALAA
jgi:hypothetical protein